MNMNDRISKKTKYKICQNIQVFLRGIGTKRLSKILKLFVFARHVIQCNVYLLVFFVLINMDRYKNNST